MATKVITVHIPPEAEPDKLIPLINHMYSEELAFESVGDLLEFTDDSGLGRRSELHLFAEACGLLKRDESGKLYLTDGAEQIAALRGEVKPDLVHFMIYTSWRESEPRNKTESWAYRTVVDNLWNMAPVDISSIADVVNEELNNEALEAFGETISFSTKSVRGLRKWMEAVSPPVVEGGVFSRRNFCHPELMLLAVGHIAQQTDAKLGVDMLLTPERREAICRLCVLEPAALDRTLDWMLPTYPQVVLPGTTAGTYGRFLRFLKWPTMADLSAR